MSLFQASLPVPDGFVLTVSFFEPWLVLLKATPAWKSFLASDQTGLREACQRLAVAATALPPEQWLSAQLELLR